MATPKFDTPGYGPSASIQIIISFYFHDVDAFFFKYVLNMVGVFFFKIIFKQATKKK